MTVCDLLKMFHYFDLSRMNALCPENLLLRHNEEQSGHLCFSMRESGRAEMIVAGI